MSEYLPAIDAGLSFTVNPERLSKILTSIGLEVESMVSFEEIKGGLNGLIVGEVMHCEKHPNADKLSLTKVNIGGSDLIQIVCGASNVAIGQKVVIAPVGATIFPYKGDSLTMKVAKIRNIESFGMICAEDEIGLNDNHDGILVLPEHLKPGTPASDFFKPYTDWIYEIGLTPNRMDAMSHMGIAKDVCAYLSHHNNKELNPITFFKDSFESKSNSLPIDVIIENSNACQRYSGVSIKNIVIKESPHWLQQKLKSIGQRPINNIVDITNFVLHETGQPLHAFDISAIKGNKIIVKNLPEGTSFVTLDEKERKLSGSDLMICNGNSEPMCIAGVFGGLLSGVSKETKSIFLESAWFNPVDIRKTSFRHELRTDAATHFEKNTDISNTVNVLKRAALLITELTGGEIASEIIDIYPNAKPKTHVTLTYSFLKKLSGKIYASSLVKNILRSLGFEFLKEDSDSITVAVPYSKPDINMAADIVEEIMRIDGLDNIEIPVSITISPSVETFGYKHIWKEKIANYLVGLGFNEVFTNSITNAAYFNKEDLEKTVTLLNNLSADHNIMRPSMLETGLECVSYNLNRKNNNLRFFEFGKIYTTQKPGQYNEANHLCLYITGNDSEDSWKRKGYPADQYSMKGIINNLFQLMGLKKTTWETGSNRKLQSCLLVNYGTENVCELGIVQSNELKKFDIKQPVFYASMYWDTLLNLVYNNDLKISELPKQLPVYRDLAMIVPSSLSFGEVEKTVKTLPIDKLQEIKLFDIFESEKLGRDKKSLALSFTFLDNEKTLNDKEIDSMMSDIMVALEKKLEVEIRK